MFAVESLPVEHRDNPSNPVQVRMQTCIHVRKGAALPPLAEAQRNPRRRKKHVCLFKQTNPRDGSVSLCLFKQTNPRDDSVSLCLFKQTNPRDGSASLCLFKQTNLRDDSVSLCLFKQTNLRDGSVSLCLFKQTNLRDGSATSPLIAEFSREGMCVSLSFHAGQVYSRRRKYARAIY
jgi:hypothetical protein